MKNTLKFLLLTLFVGLFSISTAMAQKAKKVNMKKPDKVALAFFERFANLDFAGAKELSTEESQSIFGLLEMAMSMSGAEEMEKAKAEAKGSVKNLKKATCKVTGDDAVCTFCCDANNQAIPESEFKLKKVNGKWYVHLSKEEMMGNQEIPMEEPAEEDGGQ